MRIRRFYNQYKVVNGRVSGPEDALTTNLYTPASGSFVDVSGYEFVNIVVHLGAVADDFIITPYCSDAANGTADVIDATNFAHTIANATDDDKFVLFCIEVAALPTDHHFLTVKHTSISGTNYADVVYFLGGARDEPVTQGSDVPSDHTYFYGG
jgi:hypothetical protein